jgi:ribose transport system substrate-binding protein
LDVKSIPKPIPSGLNIDFIACGLPVCTEFYKVVQSAATVLGWNVKLLNGGLTPESFTTAYNQAIQDKPSGVIGSGAFYPQLLTSQFQKLKNEGVPVMLYDAPNVPPGVTGVFVNAQNQAEYGKQLAEYVLSQVGAHGSTNVALAYSPANITSYQPMHAAFTSTLKAACPNCTISNFQFADTAIGTTLPSQTTAYVLSHPTVKYLVFDYSNEIDGLPSALQAAGMKPGQVKLLATDMTPGEAPYMAQGWYTAAAGIPWPEAMWSMMNVFAWFHDGLSTATPLQQILPNWIITPASLPSTTNYFPLVANYQSAFKKAWGK